MIHLLHLIFEPGFFGNPPVRSALLAGGIVAVVSGIVGSFAVLRGQSYAGHALADISVTGGSASFLVGVSPLWGFAGVGVLAAGVMDMIGVQRPARPRPGHRDRPRRRAGPGRAVPVLRHHAHQHHRGDDHHPVRLAVHHFQLAHPGDRGVQRARAGHRRWCCTGRCCSARSRADLAAARGIRVRLVGVLCLIAIALTVSLSALTIGAILSTALLIGPAATGLRLTSRPGLAMLWAVLIGVAATWLGVLLAYDSYYWPPGRHGWPVSFFVVTLIFVVYLSPLSPGRGRLPPGGRRRGADVLRVHGEHLGSGQHRRRGRRGGRILRRAARRRVRRRRGPAGRVHRGGRGQPARHQHPDRAGRGRRWPARSASAGSAAVAVATSPPPSSWS